jgi:phytoene synthase
MSPIYKGPACSSDVDECLRILERGSKSFAAAGRLLPAEVRGDVAVFYAFCREADDAIDFAKEPARASAALHGRLDAIFAGEPGPNPVDRALSQVARARNLPRAPFDGLLEGFAWDAEGRRYETLSEVRSYAVRVASTVGVVMTRILGRSEPHVLARAADLGIAMQLTNIARDVGEDARAGRLYLPREWFREAGVDADAWRARPEATPEVRAMVRRLLGEAELSYARADAGIPSLPAGVRPAIYAARRIYAAIGEEIRRADYDSVSARRGTSAATKARHILAALPGAFALRQGALRDPVAPEAAFLLGGELGGEVGGERNGQERRS